MPAQSEKSNRKNIGASSPTPIAVQGASRSSEIALPLSMWETDQEEAICSALRFFFISHTIDPLSGEIHTVH